MTQPMPQPVYTEGSSAPRNPITMLLGIVAGVLVVVGALLFDWLSGTPSKASDFGIEIFWSTNSVSDPSFFASAGFAVLVVGVLALIGAAFARGGLLIFTGLLATAAFVLTIVTFYRVEVADLGIGDAGLGLWMILAGGVLAIAAGAVADSNTV